MLPPESLGDGFKFHLVLPQQSLHFFIVPVISAFISKPQALFEGEVDQIFRIIPFKIHIRKQFSHPLLAMVATHFMLESSFKKFPRSFTQLVKTWSTYQETHIILDIVKGRDPTCIKGKPRRRPSHQSSGKHLDRSQTQNQKVPVA
ncbi:hypothetical protein HAX54_008788 [Datura stramonium]|uniref:Uncharacterized protein n=1 Tax=Datura stramonium TaxID=4076 RepID=A0ABS8TFA4_DATST|nr:hypothetical protein [Datura stramonium]